MNQTVRLLCFYRGVLFFKRSLTIRFGRNTAARPHPPRYSSRSQKVSACSRRPRFGPAWPCSGGCSEAIPRSLRTSRTPTSCLGSSRDCHGAGIKWPPQILHPFLLSLWRGAAYLAGPTGSTSRQYRQRYAPPHGRSGCQNSAEAPYRFPCFGRKHEFLLCSVGHFSEPGFEFCSPYHPGKSTCSPANASVRERICTPLFRETRESQTCCLHEKIDPSGRSRTVQIARPENTQQFRAIVERRQFLSLPLE